MTHQPPRDCPVCADVLNVTRLACDGCGTELSGRFTSCAYCSLSIQDRKILSVFLASRGNMKEFARELGVSYPTARIRYAELLGRLDIEEVGGLEVTMEPVDREDVLRRLAAGELDLDEATDLLR
ncbi:DUF2089 domain-containing protein [Phytoactinopolyspora mesophila]|uniref:DUF2089 family protein n=1 Tax=Phytoactinopolyspora mesophila TaxID=2650750 RepID=A0A7K3M9F8_9ACTN|nr:DUF2089 domain-containing protein [Phytoactinopolyspora mesophila]NDL59830.1 DUF2089 family protein [Phytoactinopolyspora mesophila]